MDDTLVERVRQIMQTSGLNQTDFAELIATSPDRLSKSLSGTRKFTTTELALAAQSAGTTVEWLLTGQHKATPAIAARTALAAAPSHDQISDLVSRFSTASEQLQMLADPPRAIAPLPNLAATTMYIDQADRLATDALSMVRDRGMDSTASLDLPALLEEVFSVDVAIVSLPGGLDGCAWQTELDRLIVLDRTSNWARQRFSLAHELGHILAGDAQTLIAEAVPPHSSQMSEKRANSFAASFLMPADEVRKMAQNLGDPAHFAALVNHFRVSPTSMAWRLVNLGLLTSSSVSKWQSVTAESCALTAGRPQLISSERARSEASRIPPRLLNEHLEHFYNGATSARPLAALLEMSSHDVIDLLRPVAIQK
ncbi:helix-turn-helix domain-containing protein [Arthrobacter sp. Leaf234]|uniref:helix-turn-helix domain-containing protein n=1 Tax=Arthrobacter sp. Leaf234 TaxID=1736303 RepID=UPI00138ED0A6|nr:XRE family transcriptional regulator [Arthrobacter sp. Leaf234]